MARKGENIFKRKDGRWEARYVRGYELSGKIKYGFCYGKTYREAKDKVMKARLDLQRQAKPQKALVEFPIPRKQASIASRYFLCAF